MDNKKYLNKVIEHMVRGTKISKYNSIHLSHPFPHHYLYLPSFTPRTFSSYCKNTFGLTKEEIDYVWKEYKDIIKDKINQ